jgi:hypothetical protein
LITVLGEFRQGRGEQPRARFQPMAQGDAGHDAHPQVQQGEAAHHIQAMGFPEQHHHEQCEEHDPKVDEKQRHEAEDDQLP